MPKNEPVKLVYPTNNNTQTSTIVTMNNNRVTFSSAPVQNGSLTLSPMNQMAQQGQQLQTVNMQGGNIKITNQSGQQAPTLIFKNANSSASGSFVTSSPVTMSKANNQVRILSSFICCCCCCCHHHLHDGSSVLPEKKRRREQRQ